LNGATRRQIFDVTVKPSDHLAEDVANLDGRLSEAVAFTAMAQQSRRLPLIVECVEDLLCLGARTADMVPWIIISGVVTRSAKLIGELRS